MGNPRALNALGHRRTTLPPNAIGMNPRTQTQTALVVRPRVMRSVEVDPAQEGLLHAQHGGHLADRVQRRVFVVADPAPEARALLESLRGTDLEIPARPFLREVLQ